jgi:hypothetical protein
MSVTRLFPLLVRKSYKYQKYFLMYIEYHNYIILILASKTLIIHEKILIYEIKSYEQLKY